MLYLFSGPSRKSDVRHALGELCKERDITLEMFEVDICRDPSMDLLDSSVAERCLREIENYEWDVVLVTPPCSTFSRARCVQPGPRPLRSRLYPLGFPWLSDAHRTVVEQGNEFVSFSFRICTAALSNSIPFLLEHPEDLGTTSTGHMPASIWQLPEALALFKHESVVTFSVYQCQYGAASPKPTRFLSSIRSLFGMPHVGPPRFDTTGRYLGPLPRYCGHRHKDRLLGSASTAASAAYPAGLCAEMATWIFSVFDGGGSSSSGLREGSSSGFVFSFPPRSFSVSPGRHPAELLACDCLKKGQVSQDQILRLSELLPDEDRVRQSEETVQGQRSFTSGAFVHKDRAGLRRNLDAFPFATELLARLVAHNFPGRVFSSIALFRDIKQPLHKDTTNGHYDNLLLSCSDFSGGGLWVQSCNGDTKRDVNGTSMSGEVLAWEDRKIIFDPHGWHSTEDWNGCRLVLAAYTIGNDGLLSQCDRERLLGFGFLLPGRGKRGPPSSEENLDDDATTPHVEPAQLDAAHSGASAEESNAGDLTFNELESGCEGPPMVGDFAGATDEFVDGFGRCSPGRWKPSCRGRCLSPAAVSFAKNLRDKVRRFVLDNVPDLARATFRLATGHWDGPLFASEPLNKLREEWFDMLPDPLRARELIPHQPFYLRAIAQTLRILEDPDYHIIEEGKFCFVNGVDVGHTAPLGPVPQVFRRRQKDQKYDDSVWEPIMSNYRDGPDVERALLEAFEKEESEGRMFPLSIAEARKRYPGSALRIAAQAVIPKPDHEFRVVHDGTHGVQVNNAIIMHDRLESPGAREVSAIQKLGAVSSEKVLFGLVGDVKKAHRRYLHHPEHWGVLACRSRSDSPTVWLNRTGTFGIASAAFWFARLIGLIGRLSLRVLSLIYADDLHLLSGGPNRWLNLWMLLALFCLQGTPFSEKKWRGGLQLDWVGYWIDYGRFKLGISEKRCQWIIRSVESMEGDGWLVDVRRFHELHGRLGFMSQVLVWMRPFLAPGYAWLAVVKKGAVLALPNLVRCTLRFILDRLRKGARSYPAGLIDKEYGELFRTDAACNDESVILGGWFLHKGVSCSSAPWFQLRLGRSEAPWLFKEGLGSSWASTSAELLASLVALHLLERDFAEVLSGPGSFRACFSAGTDNKAADSISARLLTTKVPVMFVLMEFSLRCDSSGIRCLLNWRPREANQEADRITKNDFSDFSADHRVAVSWDELQFSVLPSLLRFSNFQSTLDDLRADTAEEATAVPRIRFEKSQWG